MDKSVVEAYRTALYACQLIVLIPIPTILGQFLQISVLLRDPLLHFVREVIIYQRRAVDRLTLGIPTRAILAFHEAKPLTDIIEFKKAAC